METLKDYVNQIIKIKALEMILKLKMHENYTSLEQNTTKMFLEHRIERRMSNETIHLLIVFIQAAISKAWSKEEKDTTILKVFIFLS